MKILFDQGHHEFIKPGTKRWKTILSVISSINGSYHIWQNSFISRGIHNYNVVVLGDPENSFLSQFEIKTLVTFLLR